MSDANGSPPRAMEEDDDDRRPQRSPREGRSPERKDAPARKERERDPAADIIKITDDDAAFVLGKGGATKRKIARVSGAKLEIVDLKSAGASSGMEGAEIEITGTPAARQRAKDYIGYVLSQRTGPVYIDHTMRRDDLSIVMVPMDCVGYVMGRGGQVLRDMENEWGTLMFFAKKKEDEGKDAGSDGAKVQEILAIFGTRRSRRGAELKVMSAVEHKMPGHFLDGESLRVPLDQPGDGEDDDFDYDVFPFRGDEFSYALGGRGSTRKKIASAANCILEYVGQVAFLAGNERQRAQCRDYLDWLLKQKEGEFHVDVTGRDDVATVKVPTKSVGYVTGHKGEGLRSVEASTRTFCFTNGRPPAVADDGADGADDGADDAMNDAEKDGDEEEEDNRPGAENGAKKRARSPDLPKKPRGGRGGSDDHEVVLIFGDDKDDREKARRMITDKVRDHARGGGGGGGGRKRGRDDSRDRGRRGDSRDRGRGDDRGGQRRRFDSRDRGGGRRDRDRSRDRGGGDRDRGGGGRDRSHEVCRDYSKGRCNRGSDCRFRHVDN
uniref:C3H1-type domain-containing protein n=1 Tax=Micromonas pusilla TaxID=38833 RepID=A0A7S0KSC7_MICPS